MSKLREQMLRDMDLKGFSDKTKKVYIEHVARFAKYYKKSPELLGDEEIKQYLHHLLKEKKLSRSYNAQAYSGLRFLYETTLKRNWEEYKIPRSIKERKLPVVMSKEEVKRIFKVTRNLKHLAILMTIYGAGLRVGEVVKLEPKSIDIDRMQILLKEAKGHKDRYTLLSKKNLEILKQYINIYRPQKWLFEGENPENHITERTVQKIFDRAARKAGITKEVTVHTLRHSFATHLYESGIDIYYIQKLLGHSSVKTTTIYIHLSQKNALKIESPLESVLADDENE